MVPSGAGGRPQAPPPDIDIPTPPTSQTTSESQALGVLRKLLGEADANWTCREQRGAVLAVMERQADVLAIIKTGAGKTMIPVIPAMLEEDKITVIVLPLKSLMDDYIRKLGEWDVPYEFFDGSTSRLRGVANIILVSADMARMPNWKQAIGELHQRKPMVRLTFDEGQFAFDGEDFRKEALGNLYELRMFDCTQLVVMSATISEASVPALKEAFGLTDDVVVFRTKTTRPEIRYALEAPRSKRDVTSRTVDLVRSHTATFAERDRGLIFVTYLDDGETLKRLLEVDFYAGKGAKDPKTKASGPPLNQKALDEEKRSMVERWRSGDNRWMICTAAFGSGNDYSHVRVVIHSGSPMNMMNFTQEKSRAGRDGRPSLSYVLPRYPPSNTVRPTFPQGTVDHKGALAMYDWLNGPKSSVCSRYVITSFCDRIGTWCNDDPKSQPCTQCRPRMEVDVRPPHDPTVPAATATTTKDLKRPMEPDTFQKSFQQAKRRCTEKGLRDQEYVDAMRRALTHFDGRCALCTVLEVMDDNPRHDLLKCTSLGGWLYTSVDQYIKWRDGIKYQDHHGAICYFCHVPQMNERLHPQFSSKAGEACEFPDVVAMTAFGVYKYLKSKAEAGLGTSWNSLEAYTRWLSAKPITGHESNITAVLLWYHKWQKDSRDTV